MLLSILRTVGWLLEKRKSRNQKQQKVITWPAAPGRAGPCDAARPSAAMGFARSIPAASPQHPRSIPAESGSAGQPCVRYTWPLSPSIVLAPGLAPTGSGSLACRGDSLCVLGCSLLALAGSLTGTGRSERNSLFSSLSHSPSFNCYCLH